MTTQYHSGKCLFLTLLCGGWLWSQPPAAGAEVVRPPNNNSKGAFTFGRITGVFTVADFAAANGMSQAAGWLTAQVTGPTENTEVGSFTNFPVRVPVSGLLAGDPIPAALISDPVTLPQLSTNTCNLLGLLVGPIDLTIPGLGLNLHVNEISAVVRADRETTVGDQLCRLLGADLLGVASQSVGSPAPASLTEVKPKKSDLTVDQLRGLTGILFGPTLPVINNPAKVRGNSGVAPGRIDSHADGSNKTNQKLGLLQNVLERAIDAIQLPGANANSPAKRKAP